MSNEKSSKSNLSDTDDPHSVRAGFQQNPSNVLNEQINDSQRPASEGNSVVNLETEREIRTGSNQSEQQSVDLNSSETPGPSSRNNNYGSLLPIPSKPNQMIPIAVIRKTSNSSVEGNNSEASTCGGLMQIITGANKVAPAPNQTPDSTKTVGAAVLLLVPKKSDTVCVDLQSQQDPENNFPIEVTSEVPQQSANPTRSDQGIVKPTQSYDSYEEVCRICHDNPSKLELISPCLCKGSMSKVHRTCLERWLGESAKNSCEICGYEYNTVRKPKYKGCGSIYQWIRHPLSPSDMRNLFFDIACFFILTPLAAISSWLCVVGAQHYTFGDERRKRVKFHESVWSRSELRADASNATWTSVGLLSLTGTLLVAYSIWLFVAIKYHIQAWSDWQQRNYTVTIVPYEDGCMGHPPTSSRERNNPIASAHNTNNTTGTLLGRNSNVNANNNNRTYSFDIDSSPNISRTNYAGLQGSSIGRNRRNYGRQERHMFGYHLPPIYNRRTFLRNPPPGYTISETAMLYQALYGSESESFFNENILAFLADSSDNVTGESSSVLATPDFQIGVDTSEPQQQHRHCPNESQQDSDQSVYIAASSRQFINEDDVTEEVGLENAPLATQSDHLPKQIPACSSSNYNKNNNMNCSSHGKVIDSLDLHTTRSLNGSLKSGASGSVNNRICNPDRSYELETRGRPIAVAVPINYENDGNHDGDNNANANHDEMV